MLKWILAAFLLVGVVGCEFIAPIGPIVQLGIMWVEGEAHKYYNTDQETIHQATLVALKELDLVVNKEESSNDGETIYINAGDKDRFKIKIHAVREKTTKLSVRVDIMGDKPYAEMLYRHVDKQKDVVQFVTVEELNTALEDQPRRDPRRIRR
jgi:hypothetical protein